MSQYGEIYTEIDASVVNNSISTLSISGESGSQEGEEVITAWLLWTYEEATGNGGFTGRGWYFYETPLSGTFQDETAFKNYLIQNTPDNLDEYLGNWRKEDKIDFINKHDELYYNNCIEYR